VRLASAVISSSAAGRADAQRGDLVGQEHVRFLVEQGAAAAGARGPLERHLRRDEDVLQAEIEAAAALQAGHPPVVDDLGRLLGHDGDHHAAVIPGFPEAGDQPVGLRDTACEAPPSAHQEAASHRPSGAARPRRPDDERQRAAGREDPARPGVRQPAAGRPGAAVPDHDRPGGRGVRVRQFLHHVAEVERLQRRPAELGRRLQPEHAHLAQRLDDIRRRGAQLLGPFPGGLELRAAAPDSGQQFAANRGAVSAARASILAHGPPGKLACRDRLAVPGTCP